MTTIPYEIDDIDDIVLRLDRLRAMFGAIVYILNPNRNNKDCDSENMEIWLAEVQDKIDEIIKKIAGAQ